MMREMLDYTERMTRAALRNLPDGEYDFEDWIDDDGVDFGKRDPALRHRAQARASTSPSTGPAAHPRSGERSTQRSR